MATVDAQDQDLRERIGRFRVLIVGRANAGKTTILQKVCNTSEDPEIYDTKGEKIDAAVVKSSIKRGNHDIANEMVFKSSPGFVFHDSCGFEAGSEEEFENMKKFISQRANATELGERVHAIWYCIPMDNPSRTFQRSEEKFFLECDTGHVPVVAVFTKFEALRPVAFGELKKQFNGLSKEERLERIAHRVEELFTNTGVWDRLCDPENRARPKCYVRLENMNKPNANCDMLVERTTLALDNEELRLCLVSTQQSNVELCIKCAIETLVDCAHRLFSSLLSTGDGVQYDIAKWFPHLQLYYYNHKKYKKTHKTHEKTHNVPGFNDKLFNVFDVMEKDSIRVLQPLAAKGTQSTAANAIIQTGIATILVLEYSAFLPNDNLQWGPHHLKSAVDYYLKSPTAVGVEKVAKEISLQSYKKEEQKKKILEFILENRMSKDLAAKK